MLVFVLRFLLFSYFKLLLLTSCLFHFKSLHSSVFRTFACFNCFLSICLERCFRHLDSIRVCFIVCCCYCIGLLGCCIPFYFPQYNCCNKASSPYHQQDSQSLTSLNTHHFETYYLPGGRPGSSHLLQDCLL